MQSTYRSSERRFLTRSGISPLEQSPRISAEVNQAKLSATFGSVQRADLLHQCKPKEPTMLIPKETAKRPSRIIKRELAGGAPPSSKQKNFGWKVWGWGLWNR